jgi:hypothetical protein
LTSFTRKVHMFNNASNGNKSTVLTKEGINMKIFLYPIKNKFEKIFKVVSYHLYMAPPGWKPRGTRAAVWCSFLNLASYELNRVLT